MSQPVDSATNNMLKCAGCGAQLRFVPGTDNLHCDYCGQDNAIGGDPGQGIISVDLDEYVANIGSLVRDTGKFIVVDCSNCGSKTVLEKFVTADKCPFCTAPLVLRGESMQFVPPHYILPFEITQKQAVNFFKSWLAGLRWAPNDLEKNAGIDTAGLKGIYLPHWAYDMRATTTYSGQRGDHYYTTETYTETLNGRTETKTRSVQHTSWTSVQGKVYDSFKDILVPATKSIPEATLNNLRPWKLEELVGFDERYTSGFRSETYQIDPAAGFSNAANQTVDAINSSIRNDIGGDEQRIDDSNTVYSNKAIKYLVLPVWASAYKYNGKVYQFTVNATTGEVTGERPLSVTKIVLVVLLGLGLIAAAILIYHQSQAQ